MTGLTSGKFLWPKEKSWVLYRTKQAVIGLSFSPGKLPRASFPGRVTSVFMFTSFSYSFIGPFASLEVKTLQWDQISQKPWCANKAFPLNFPFYFFPESLEAANCVLFLKAPKERARKGTTSVTEPERGSNHFDIIFNYIFYTVPMLWFKKALAQGRSIKPAPYRPSHEQSSWTETGSSSFTLCLHFEFELFNQ